MHHIGDSFNRSGVQMTPFGRCGNGIGCLYGLPGRAVGDRRLRNAGRAHSARRTEATASATSASDGPNSANLARTAPARVIRTGVSTMQPFSPVTSKYSVPSKSDRTAFGRVNWFFEVSLASI